MIDQEGFRSATAAFKLVGFTDVGPGGIAHFLPIRRKISYRFHHAMLDSDPVLYRIQVNGEEKRDYLSRQATLTLKSPGVYTVSGTETLRGSPSAAIVEPIPDNFLSLADATIVPATGTESKLEWLFTYCVELRTGARGQVLEGERTFRPMSFACSPMLLHASQGRKVGLFRLAAKLVQPKLAAQRVAPPAPPRGVENVPVDVRAGGAGDPGGPEWLGLGAPWGDTHARGNSHASEDSRPDDEERPLIKHLGRPKAASVGERRRPTFPAQFIDAANPSTSIINVRSQKRRNDPVPQNAVQSRVAPTQKLDAPMFNDLFEELSAFGFIRHRPHQAHTTPSFY